ncbi:uroporphyrinogen decarboxylase family protein [Cellulosilyticum sp. I15G10I2]|uniref:uroporphyrinogen decarboxylase family protein n=1 Tax=Cellulosilyticum sp. I15G10I2 TaxID=1892843 RepID=UPI00085C13B4|nr:uroporphyrinogen decarboxylase family protein [Cellulosilyticum sp. I15G10I2]
MNSYERVMARLQGKEVDKIPNLNIVMAFAAKYINIPYSHFAADYRYLVEGNIKCCEAFGIDVVTAMSDPWREAHSFGAKIIFPEDDIPYCNEKLIKDYAIVKDLKVKSPFEDERLLDRIRAIELYKKEVGGKYPIVGWVEGALAEAADLRGVSELMMDLILEPEAVTELFEKIYEVQYAFMKAQVEAGADIIGIGDAVASLIGPELYCQYALPYEKRIIQDIHKLGAQAKLHICGNIEPLLEDIAAAGADIVDIDWMVNFEKAVELFKGTRTCACGNMDPVAVFLKGNKEIITREVGKCMAMADEKTLLAAGCEIPKYTNFENLKLMNSMLYI